MNSAKVLDQEVPLKDGPQIFRAITSAMQDITPITKSRSNPQQHYNFRGIDDIFNSLQPIFAKHGIFSVPTVLEYTTDSHPSKSGGTLYRTILKMQYRFYAADGSYVDAITQGEAMDSGDKGSNKAMSAALKYALLQIFAIPTEDPKDTESESPEIVYAVGHYSEPPVFLQKSDEKISDAQLKRLHTIASKNGRSNEEAKTIVKRFGYESSKDIQIKNYDLIIAALEAKKSS